jgi:hypothetical protein
MPEQHITPNRGLASRAATAAALVGFLAVGMTAVWLATSDVASQDDPVGGERVTFPREVGVGACLHLADPRATDMEPGAETLARTAAAHDHLFPALASVTVPPRPPEHGTIVALWPNGAPSSGAAAIEASRVDAACAAAESGWTLRVTRDLLADGADRLLEQAEFGDDWSARIDVSFHPRQSRVRTKLDFSGPFGVNGACWIDETFVIHPENGLPDVITKSQNDAGLAGLVACRRFERELADGGAGAQALALLATTLRDEATGPSLTVSRIDVTDELIALSGANG